MDGTVTPKTYELVVYDDGCGALSEFDRDGESGRLSYVGRAWLDAAGVSRMLAAVTPAGSRADVERLRAGIEGLRRTHEPFDEDCWYACPKSGACCNDNAGDRCTCGADWYNAQIDALLAGSR